MSCRNCNEFNSNRNKCLPDVIRDLVGETVTIFTKSGGKSGCGFTGVLVKVTGDDFVTLVTRRGSAPACPLARPDSSCCNEMEKSECCCNDSNNVWGSNNKHQFSVGSEVDIPICKIAAFCHSAL